MKPPIAADAAVGASTTAEHDVRWTTVRKLLAGDSVKPLTKQARASAPPLAAHASG